MALKVYKINYASQQDPLNEPKMVIEIDKSMQLAGDLYFRIKHRGQFKNKLLCRFALNTSFVVDKYVFIFY